MWCVEVKGGGREAGKGGFYRRADLEVEGSRIAGVECALAPPSGRQSRWCGVLLEGKWSEEKGEEVGIYSCTKTRKVE